MTRKPSPRRAGWAFAAVCAGVFLAALDQTMVVTVLPSILQGLRIPLTRLDSASWIITGYLLGYTVAMPLFGRIADVRGRRLMYAVALGIFVSGSAFCVVSPNLNMLVGARVIQAAGGGALVPIGMSIATEIFPAARRALALGIIGAAAEAGGVLGPVYGAGLASLGGWKLIFLINVPLGLLIGVSTWLLLHTLIRHGAVGGGAPGRVDYAGAAFMAIALASLTIGLGGNAEVDSLAVKPWWLIGSIVAFVVFVLWELRQKEPLIRLSFFRDIRFTAANIASLAVGTALIVGMVEIPLYAYSLLGKSEVEGGLLLMRLTVMIPVGAVLGGWLADRLGYVVSATAGFLAIAAGYFLITLWPQHPGELLMTRDLALAGLGFGLVIAPLGATVIAVVGKAWTATGSALITVTRMVGMTVGLAALSSWGIRRFNRLMADTPLPLRSPDMTDAQYNAAVQAYEQTINTALQTLYSNFFLICAVIALVAVVPALMLSRGSGRPKQPLPPL
ncbi:MAG: MFS transporter [Actinobacteria bacterium]|nr:MFS transporter [Actinomycetota bacterium]